MGTRKGWIMGYHTRKDDNAFRVRGKLEDGGPLVTLAEYPPILIPRVVDHDAAIKAMADWSLKIVTPKDEIETTGPAAVYNVASSGRILEGFRGKLRTMIVEGNPAPTAKWVADTASGLYTLADVEAVGSAPRTVDKAALEAAMKKGDLAEIARLTGIQVA